MRECSVYHNARMSLARPLASKLINFEQPCTLIFSSPFPTSCRAWSSLHLWPWVRYVARRNLCVLEERKIMLSCSIVRSFCLNCQLFNNLRGQWFCFVVYDQSPFLFTALRLSEASGILYFLKFFPHSPDCPHLSSSSESLNLLFFQTQKSVSLFGRNSLDLWFLYTKSQSLSLDPNSTEFPLAFYELPERLSS